MQNIRLLALVAISAIFLLPACTFQKRVHNRGFHIDWSARTSIEVSKTHVNQKQSAGDKLEVKGEIAAKDSLFALRKEPLWDEPVQEVLAGGNEQENRIVQVPIVNIFQKELKAKKEQFKLISKPLNKKQEKDLDIISIIGLMLGVMSMASVVLLFITDFELLILFSILGAILAIVLSAISLKRIKNNPEKWMGKGIALAGIFVGSITILFWVFLMVLFLLFF
jgi:hypothetical protein